MRMARSHQHFAILSLAAAIHLLLFSVCPVTSRIYQTNDAVVIEVDDVRSSTLANRHSGNPQPPIPMMYAVSNPYTGGLSYQQQPNFPFWPYPALYSRPASSLFSADDSEKITATSPESKQQKVACGVGPASPPQRNTPTVGIIGGSNATPNSWPFIVGLRVAGTDVLFCGGSIISTTRILTAAHCVYELSAYDISTMTVKLGIHTQEINNLFQDDAQQTRRVLRVVYHKDFNRKKWLNDIAVLTIDPPINYSKAISPICLPPFNNAADQFVGQNATFIGWGKTTATGNVAEALQQTTIPIISNANCNTAWGFSSTSPIFNQHICAGADGKDTCSGDSGGPMVLQTNVGSTAWTQVGITSFGKNCPASSAIPSVYASVAFFRNWINTYMNS